MCIYFSKILSHLPGGKHGVEHDGRLPVEKISSVIELKSFDTFEISIFSETNKEISLDIAGFLANIVGIAV